MFFLLLTCFTLWTFVLIAIFETYVWILHRVASWSRKFRLLFGYSLYCLIGGIVFVLPLLGFELMLGNGAFMVQYQTQIADFGVAATTYGSPIIAYWFFQRRHIATLKKLGYFLPIKRP